MKKINDTLNQFHQGFINKTDFIREMYQLHHAKLFDYAQHLSKTNIKKIEIEDGKIIMVSRDRGVRILCVPGDFRVVPIETLNFLDYEINDANMIDLLLDDQTTFLDIGANMGWYSINIGLAHRDAQIHCFEPIPHTYAFLQENLRMNAVPNVTAHNFGFSNTSGDFDFYYYGEGSGNASSANLSDREDVQVLKCKVSTLDEFVNREKISIDFIKCDVEGAELMVFQGGEQTILRDTPIVFAEILRKWSAKFKYNPNEIFDFFKSKNYRAFATEGDKLKEFFLMDESTVATNFFFLHNIKHSEKIRQFCF
jgi:FkbM family methyltransferase